MVCREFGWDYYTYENQPPFFIEEILLIMNQEGQKEKRDMKKQSRLARKTR